MEIEQISSFVSGNGQTLALSAICVLSTYLVYYVHRLRLVDNKDAGYEDLIPKIFR